MGSNSTTHLYTFIIRPCDISRPVDLCRHVDSACCHLPVDAGEKRPTVRCVSQSILLCTVQSYYNVTGKKSYILSVCFMQTKTNLALLLCTFSKYRFRLESIRICPNNFSADCWTALLLTATRPSFIRPSHLSTTPKQFSCPNIFCPTKLCFFGPNFVVLS